MTEHWTMGKRRRTVQIIGLCLTGLAAVFVILAGNNVSRAVTPADRFYGLLMLSEAGYGNILASVVGQRLPASFSQRIRLIAAVQDAVLKETGSDVPIPLDRPRELMDLYRSRSGSCYDRSRGIEKLLMVLGFKTRHVAIYDNQDNSHALTEAKTAEGWVMVDSNTRWIGPPAISSQLPPAILARPHALIYGLYSRHGRFYWPYLPIPDVNWRELLYNLTPEASAHMAQNWSLIFAMK